MTHKCCVSLYNILYNIVYNFSSTVAFSWRNNIEFNMSYGWLSRLRNCKAWNVFGARKIAPVNLIPPPIATASSCIQGFCLLKLFSFRRLWRPFASALPMCVGQQQSLTGADLWYAQMLPLSPFLSFAVSIFHLRRHAYICCCCSTMIRRRSSPSV